MIKILSRFLPVVLLAAMAGNVVLLGISQDACNDVWTHALHGRIALERGRTPKFSDYGILSSKEDIKTQVSISFTQIILYSLLYAFDYPGLLLLKVVLLSFICFFIVKTLALEKIPLPTAAFGCLLFMILGYHRFLPRGDFFNLLFFAIYIWLLEKYRRMPGRYIWSLVPLQFFWINFHPLALMGVGLIGLYAVDGKKNRMLFIVALAALLASFFNPMGFQKVFLPFHVLCGVFQTEKEIYQSVHEFARLPLAVSKFFLYAYYITFAIGLTLLLGNWRKFWRHLLIFLGLGVSSWLFARLVGFFAVHSAIVIPWLFFRTSIVTRIESSPKLRLCGIFLIIAAHLSLGVGVVTQRFFKLNRDVARCWPHLSNLLIPVDAVQFLQKRHFSGNLYTDYNTGGYAGYRLYPQSRIFIHSLTLCYPISHFKLYDRIACGDLPPRMIPYRIDAFLLFHNTGENNGLIRRLNKDKNHWPLVYLDESTVIFADCNSPLANTPPLDLPAVGRRPEIARSPRRLIALGNFFAFTGRFQEARTVFQRVLEREPKNSIALNNLGRLAEEAKNFQEALEFYVESACAAPDYMLPRRNILRLFRDKLVFQRQRPLHRKAVEVCPDITKVIAK